jgi:hypothetical protein
MKIRTNLLHNMAQSAKSVQSIQAARKSESIELSAKDIRASLDGSQGFSTDAESFALLQETRYFAELAERRLQQSLKYKLECARQVVGHQALICLVEDRLTIQRIDSRSFSCGVFSAQDRQNKKLQMSETDERTQRRLDAELKTATMLGTAALKLANYWTAKQARITAARERPNDPMKRLPGDCCALVLGRLLQTSSLVAYQNACISCSDFARASRVLISTGRQGVVTLDQRFYSGSTRATTMYMRMNPNNQFELVLSFDSPCPADEVVVLVPDRTHGPALLDIESHTESGSCCKTFVLYLRSSRSFYRLSGPFKGFTRTDGVNTVTIGLGSAMEVQAENIEFPADGSFLSVNFYPKLSTYSTAFKYHGSATKNVTTGRVHVTMVLAASQNSYLKHLDCIFAYENGISIMKLSVQPQ